MRQYTTTEIASIREMRQARLTLPEIAKRLGRSFLSVKWCVRHYNIPRAPRFDTAVICAEVRAGIEPRIVADRHGIGYRKVLKIVKEHGVVKPKPNLAPRILALREQGYLHREIAAEVGLRRETVGRICRRENL